MAKQINILKTKEYLGTPMQEERIEIAIKQYVFQQTQSQRVGQSTDMRVHKAQTLEQHLKMRRRKKPHRGTLDECKYAAGDGGRECSGRILTLQNDTHMRR
jgi:hypothetical protein